MKKHSFLFIVVGSALSMNNAALSQDVVVNSGDTLSSLAEKELGSANLWPEICEANRDVLRNCDYIAAGMTLSMPDRTVGSPSAPETPALDVGTKGLVVNGSFTNGDEGWVLKEGGSVVGKVQNGALRLEKVRDGIDGAPSQTIAIMPGEVYQLQITLVEGNAAYRAENSDKEFIQLSAGVNFIDLGTSDDTENITLSFWPYSTGSSAVIDDVSLTPK